jgi:hypothetical protein
VKQVHENQLAIIRCAFQSDLTRVATFTSGHGNNEDQVHKYFNPPDFPFQGDGHGCSHNGKMPDALKAKAEVSKIFIDAVAKMLVDMNSIPEGPAGGTMLDNTLDFVFSECSDGDGHSVVGPCLWAGGKWLKLQTGQHIFTPDKYINSFWISFLKASGVQLPLGAAGSRANTEIWGDPAMCVDGPLAGVFG